MCIVSLCLCVKWAIRSSSNLHPHLRGEWGQRRECPAGQNDGADALIHQLLHAEARRKAPVTQYVSYKVPRKTQKPFKQVYSQEHREDSETKWNTKHFTSIWMLISTWVREVTAKDNTPACSLYFELTVNVPTINRKPTGHHLVSLMRMKPKCQYSVFSCVGWCLCGCEPESKRKNTNWRCHTDTWSVWRCCFTSIQLFMASDGCTP